MRRSFGPGTGSFGRLDKRGEVARDVLEPLALRPDVVLGAWRVDALAGPEQGPPAPLGMGSDLLHRPETAATMFIPGFSRDASEHFALDDRQDVAPTTGQGQELVEVHRPRPPGRGHALLEAVEQDGGAVEDQSCAVLGSDGGTSASIRAMSSSVMTGTRP